jgi:hypothetical protein
VNAADLLKMARGWGEFRGKYRKWRRPKFSDTYLLAYLRDHGIKSKRDLAKRRQDGDPVAYDFEKAFGSWSAALRRVFVPEFKKSPDKDYLVKVVLSFGLWSLRDWDAARAKEPSVIPSPYYVEKLYGGFRALFAKARSVSCEHIISDYLKLWRRLGRVPSFEEARENQIKLEPLIRICGSKKKLDEVAGDLERQYERTSRSV